MSPGREPTERDAGWLDLLADVHNEQQIDAELLVRYANDAAALTQAERELVERALDASPEAADTLRALQGADWDALRAAGGPPASAEARAVSEPSWLEKLREAFSFSQGMGFRLGLAGAAILLLLFSLPLLRQEQTGRGPETRVAKSDPPPDPPFVEPDVVESPPAVEPGVGTEVAPESPESAPAPPRDPILLAMAEPQYRLPAGFEPRPRGASVVRGGAEPLRIQAVVPEHVGRTALAKPTLYWAVDGSIPADAELMFVITDEDAIDPLATTPLARPAAPGLQAISLSELGVELATGVEYRWSVRVMSPDADLLSSTVRGWIRRVELPPDVARQIDDAVPDNRAAAQAAAGLWYDAFSEVQHQKSLHPNAVSVTAAESALLSQVGLESLPSTQR